MEFTCIGAPGRPGPLAQGCNTHGLYSGAGGGGYFGGGAGLDHGGGGGGSSYSLYRVIDQGYNLGSGYAVIEWDWVGPSKSPTPVLSSRPTITPFPSKPPPSNHPTKRPTPTPTALAVSPLILQYTGFEQNFLVPASVTSLKVTLYGGSGAIATNTHGRGAMISSIIPVIPGEVLAVVVASAGMNGNYGGYNGGGKGTYFSYAGGGATDVRRSPFTLADRIIVEGGGGSGSGAVGSFGGDGGLNATRYFFYVSNFNSNLSFIFTFAL